MSRAAALLGLSLATCACWLADDRDVASREEVIEAARGCGVERFEPTPAGDGWAAYVPQTEPNAREKEDCIYSSLRSRGLLVTR